MQNKRDDEKVMGAALQRGGTSRIQDKQLRLTCELFRPGVYFI